MYDIRNLDDLQKLKIEEQLLALDDCGFFPKPHESETDFTERAKKEFFLIPDISDEPMFIQAETIPDEILKEGAERTIPIFGFSAHHIKGYFLKRGLGPFWAGCTLSDENNSSLFVLRNGFAKSRKYLFYERSELLAHEQCHAARTPLHDNVFEEQFAYMTSNSAFRRYFGNCFRSQSDAFVFLAGVIILLLAEFVIFSGVAEFQIWPFVIVAFLGPLFLFFRNQISRCIYFKAKHNLLQVGFFQPDALLFRATASEIKSIAKLPGTELTDYLNILRIYELRWKIALMKFPNSNINE